MKTKFTAKTQYYDVLAQSVFDIMSKNESSSLTHDLIDFFNQNATFNSDGYSMSIDSPCYGLTLGDVIKDVDPAHIDKFVSSMFPPLKDLTMERLEEMFGSIENLKEDKAISGIKRSLLSLNMSWTHTDALSAEPGSLVGHKNILGRRSSP